MHVNIKLVGWMREFLGDGIAHFDDEDFDLAAGTTIADLTARFRFGEHTQFMVMCNGERVLEADYANTALNTGDQVVFVPPLKGG